MDNSQQPSPSPQREQLKTLADQLPEEAIKVILAFARKLVK